VAETELADRDQKIAGLTEQIASLTAQLATAESSRTALEASLAQLQAERDTARAQLTDMVQLKSFHLPKIDTGRTDEEESNDRLRQRIGKLSQMAKSVAQERENADPVEPGTADPLVLEKLSDAERQTADLQEELEKLDAEWSKRLGELNDGAPPAIANQPGAVANVISLANRIRALKKDIGSG
jgi:chromosome segregation ATPase